MIDYNNNLIFAYQFNDKGFHDQMIIIPRNQQVFKHHENEPLQLKNTEYFNDFKIKFDMDDMVILFVANIYEYPIDIAKETINNRFIDKLKMLIVKIEDFMDAEDKYRNYHLPDRPDLLLKILKEEY